MGRPGSEDSDVSRGAGESQRERQEVDRIGAQEAEPPVGGIVPGLCAELRSNALWGVEIELERPGRESEAEAAGLQVRPPSGSRPVEAPGSQRRRELLERPAFRRGERLARELVEPGLIDLALDVHADVVIERHRADHELARVRRLKRSRVAGGEAISGRPCSASSKRQVRGGTGAYRESVVRTSARVTRARRRSAS